MVVMLKKDRIIITNYVLKLLEITVKGKFTTIICFYLTQTIDSTKYLLMYYTNSRYTYLNNFVTN